VFSLFVSFLLLITYSSYVHHRCMRIEIGEDVWAHFQYVNASQDRNAIQMYGVLPADGFSGAEIRAELHDHILTR